MTGNEPRYSRVNRKKMRNRSNRLLNIMIGLVVLLIIIVGASIIIGNNDHEGKESASEEKVLDNAGSSEEEESESEEDASVIDSEDENGTNEQSNERDEDQGQIQSDEAGESESKDNGAIDEEESDIEKNVPDNDQIISETIIDRGWQPIGTDQTGEHVSEYEDGSIDYNEKKKAIAYATGFTEDELFYKRVKNGGGPQKSIGIVTTKDGSNIFRVYIEWVDGKGWKPVKMDVLKTLDFEY